MERLADLASILRYHIVLIAMAATVVFGRILTGEDPWAVALVVGIDWLFINLFNRVTDLDEDQANRIPGTDLVARHQRRIRVGSAVLLAGSFVLTQVWMPELTLLRALVQLVGFGYNYRIVPTSRGFTRFKELYFFKNFMSAVLFVLTAFLYPVARAGWDPASGWVTVFVLALFFVPFELTYEILYDFRDLPGDRELGVPTYPAVHGEAGARRILGGLLLFSFTVPVGAFLLGGTGARELLFAAAPLVQVVAIRPMLRRGVRPRDCIRLTHLGTALLLLFLAGNHLWLGAGLPENYWFAA